MNFAISGNKSWLLLLLVAFVALAPNIYAQDDFYDEDSYMEENDDSFSVEVRGTTSERVAVGRAYKKAMMQFLEENLEEGYFEGNANKIESFLGKNWKKYRDRSRKHIIEERLSRREWQIRVSIKQDSLLSKVESLVKKADNKLDGLWIAIVADKENNPYQNVDPKKKDESTDRDVMFDYVQNRLGKHMKIRDLRALDRLMKKEAQMLGMAAGADPQAFVARKFAQLNGVVYLWLSTRRIDRDPATGTPVWHATVGCRLVHIQTAQELVKFQISSGPKAAPVGVFGGLSERMARSKAIENVCEAVYNRVYNQIRTRQTVLQEHVYTLKFVKFSSREERKIREAILTLKDGRRAPAKIEGSVGGGTGYMEYTLKWRRTSDSQADIIDIISGFCEENEVMVDSNKSTKGVIYFEPVSYDGDEEY